MEISVGAAVYGVLFFSEGNKKSTSLYAGQKKKEPAGAEAGN